MKMLLSEGKLEAIKSSLQMIAMRYTDTDANFTKLRNWAIAWVDYLDRRIRKFESDYDRADQPGLSREDLADFGAAMASARAGVVAMEASATNANKTGQFASISLLLAGFFGEF